MAFRIFISGGRIVISDPEEEEGAIYASAYPITGRPLRQSMMEKIINEMNHHAGVTELKNCFPDKKHGYGVSQHPHQAPAEIRRCGGDVLLSGQNRTEPHVRLRFREEAGEKSDEQNGERKYERSICRKRCPGRGGGTASGPGGFRLRPADRTARGDVSEEVSIPVILTVDSSTGITERGKADQRIQPAV